MDKANVYNQAGEIVGEIQLNPHIFSVPVKQQLVEQAVQALLANRRLVIADTKGRGEVRGGGKKPWKQKGTGRARHGSIRSPIWKGGGVTFGPTSDRNFKQKINKKMRTKALFMGLSAKAEEQAVLVLDKLELKEAKTKLMSKLFKKIKSDKSTLFVIEKMEAGIVRAVRNLAGVEVIAANSLNIYDVIKNKNILITNEALKKIEEVYLPKKK